MTLDKSAGCRGWGGEGGRDPAPPVPEYHLQTKSHGVHMLVYGCVSQVTGVEEHMRPGREWASKRRGWSGAVGGFAFLPLQCFISFVTAGEVGKLSNAVHKFTHLLTLSLLLRSELLFQPPNGEKTIWLLPTAQPEGGKSRQ